MIRLILTWLFLATAAQADVLVAARTIPAQAIITADDLLFRDLGNANGISDAARVIGQEARVALFAGRPIRPQDIGTPAVVDRNQLIPLLFTRGGLVIKAEGRALNRAGPGDVIRVMNIASRNTVTARIDGAGVGHVTQ